jgi:hypothetical protein
VTPDAPPPADIAGLLTHRFGVDVTGQATAGLSWTNGPSLRTAVTALREAGLPARGAPGWTAHEPDGRIRDLTRHLCPVTVTLALLRDPSASYRRLQTRTDLPPGGLTPESQAEQIAVTLILDRLPAGTVPSSKTAMQVITALTGLGGAAAVLDASGLLLHTGTHTPDTHR